MGFTSQDDLINQVTTNGKIEPVVYQKTSVAVGQAGHWQHLLNSVGSIPAATFGGSEATFTATDNTWSEGAIAIGDQRLWSRVTARAAAQLALAEGKAVVALIRTVAVERQGVARQAG